MNSAKQQHASTTAPTIARILAIVIPVAVPEPATDADRTSGGFGVVSTGTSGGDNGKGGSVGVWMGAGGKGRSVSAVGTLEIPEGAVTDGGSGRGEGGS